MTKIVLIHLDSGRHDRARFDKDRREFLAPLQKEFELITASPGEGAHADLQVVFIASGGCEQKFRLHYPLLTRPVSQGDTGNSARPVPQGDAGNSARPVILLSDGKHNSLPAALEISSWVRQQGGRAEIVHGRTDLVIARLRQLALFQRCRDVLAGRIGVIGEPSDWLIASSVDRVAVNARWGTDFVDIGLDEMSGQQNGAEEAEAVAREFIAAAGSLERISEEAVQQAALLVPALKAIFARHRLQAATLRCFSLIETLHTSGCLALARLNDEDLVCGCEGDVPAVFSMLLANALSGECSFMANPAAVDTENNRVLFAHCTVPRRAVAGYGLQTHFETGLGVALCGEFPPGPATVFKVGGPGLDSYFVSAAEVLPGKAVPGLCRTQVLVQLQEPVDYFLKRPLANHHLLVRGDHSRVMDGFMRFFGATRIG